MHTNAKLAVRFSVSLDHLGQRMPTPETISFVDDRLIFMMNIDAAYHVPIEGATWNPYAGGGLGIGIENNDNSDKTTVKAGLNLFGGIEWGAAQYRYFFEVRTQIGTSMGDFTVLGGVNF